jgi:two-component system, NarL family, sensor kinase
MMRQRIRKILRLIGPYPYNPYLLFLLFFLIFFSRYIPAIVNTPRGAQRVEAAAIVMVISLIPGLGVSGLAWLLQKYRFWSAQSTFLYILEIVFVQTTLLLYIPLIQPTMNQRFGYAYKIAISASPNIFLVSLVFVLIMLALVHQAERKIVERLADADLLVDQLKVDRQQLVEADERVRGQTSRFLHDRVQSELMVIGMKLRSISGKADDQVNEVIERAISQLENTRASDLKNLVQVLAPNFELGGLSGALSILFEQYRGSMDASLEIDNATENLKPEPLLGIFRIIEQSLVNSLVHGPAKRVQISVKTSSAGITELIVSDDGPGSSPDVTRSGAGSAIINSWVGILNGRKAINTSPDHGYLLMVVFPQ